MLHPPHETGACMSRKWMYPNFRQPGSRSERDGSRNGSTLAHSDRNLTGRIFTDRKPNKQNPGTYAKRRSHHRNPHPGTNATRRLRLSNCPEQCRNQSRTDWRHGQSRREHEDDQGHIRNGALVRLHGVIYGTARSHCTRAGIACAGSQGSDDYGHSHLWALIRPCRKTGEQGR